MAINLIIVSSFVILSEIILPLLQLSKTGRAARLQLTMISPAELGSH
jgi:hypothetical protein